VRGVKSVARLLVDSFGCTGPPKMPSMPSIGCASGLIREEQCSVTCHNSESFLWNVASAATLDELCSELCQALAVISWLGLALIRPTALSAVIVRTCATRHWSVLQAVSLTWGLEVIRSA